MRYFELGQSGVKVSQLTLGGMSFGQASESFHLWTVDQDTTTSIIRRALDLGVTTIDTANIYSHGTSEEFIGRSLKELGVRREDVVVASKVFYNEGALKARAIEREAEATLKRLGTDYLDLYIIHRFDYSTPIAETMEALHNLVVAGKVRAIGASEMYAYQYHNMQIVARDNGWTPFTTMQCHYNLLYRESEREMLPVVRQFGALPTPYSPLASGHLARSTWDSSSLRSTTDRSMARKYDGAQEHDMPIIRRVAEVAERLGVPMSAVALAWHWAHGPASPIVGCSSPERVEQAVAATSLKLSDDDVAYLEEPYVAHELMGPLARPGEKELGGTWQPPAKPRLMR
ncbi:aldo/keto reductase [Arcanobacterium haemolyticum]|nr:aldo/keto reductase [Arcanobacterium haemolyticum]